MDLATKISRTESAKPQKLLENWEEYGEIKIYN